MLPEAVLVKVEFFYSNNKISFLQAYCHSLEAREIVAGSSEL